MYVHRHDQIGAKSKEEARKIAEQDLRQVVENLARHVFGDVEMRWVYDHFPFTDPSLELEIFYKGDWLEIVGSGVIHEGVMTNSNRENDREVGWAFGLGLERWAMKLFDIPDIRLFWSQDPRFIKQFKKGEISTF